MVRRLAALALWGYFAWYLGAMLADITGSSPVVGPVAGALTVAVGAIQWGRAHRRNRVAVAAPELQPTH